MRNKVAEHKIGYLQKASDIRQKENVSSGWEFPKIENEQIKAAQNNSYRYKNWVKLPFYFSVEINVQKRQVKGKFGHLVQIRAWRKRL